MSRDIGPSLAKLRRDWSDSASVDVPSGMIARRIILAATDKLAAGHSITIERIGARKLRIAKSPSPEIEAEIERISV